MTAPAFGLGVGDAPGVARFMLDAAVPDFCTWDAAVTAQPDRPISYERAGADMLYSSDTTGAPRGVRPALPANPDIAGMTAVLMVAQEPGLGLYTTYLTPGPVITLRCCAGR